MNHSDHLFRIVAKGDWLAAQAQGQYRGADHDIRDGYLHLSTRHQVAGTLTKHYAGQSDLLILAIDATKVGAPVRFERSRGGELFPHLYGPLPVAAVTKATDAAAWSAAEPDGTP